MARKQSTSDEARLQQHLNEQPGDMDSRRILADLLEEQGRDDEAKAQRLLADRKLWPDNDLAFCGQTGWHWWTIARGKHRHRRHAAIPRRLHKLMPEGEWLYRTRVQAEKVLLQALRAAGEF